VKWVAAGLTSVGVSDGLGIGTAQAQLPQQLPLACWFHSSIFGSITAPDQGYAAHPVCLSIGPFIHLGFSFTKWWLSLIMDGGGQKERSQF
jgi:hypothetical protein